MNKLLVFLVTISFSVAVPILEDAHSKILTYSNENDGVGNYDFSFETSNGISRQESGRLVNVGQSDEHLEVQGTYSYTDANGELVVVHYRADEDGFNIKEELPQIAVVDVSKFDKILETGF